ncbi:hypothetical protein F5Y05DRAFT_239073 [Hypoxylon sp. FL0543]|nr:hypothetical protein F5Y05DRAFT_239073 [Hypoxylon sp. FL0543]
MAVKWNVCGGKGGQPGEHGHPGQGGVGGKGGKGHEWEARVGYVYSCTDRCIGGGATNSSSTLVRYKSVVEKGSNLALARIGAQAVSGGNMAMLMAQAATRFHALRNPQVNPGACKCHGGEGNCTGCDSDPVIRKFKRVEGLDGEDGHPGTLATRALHSGLDGLRGSVTIIVQKSDGSQQEYSSLYSLELVDFDVEDENGDGIFEPGEHLFVRRITVRNSGGMPSPARPIGLNMVESSWFKLVDGHDGRTLLPSIKDGSSVTIDTFIKVRIREREEYETLQAGTIFVRHDAIRLSAIMPWIEREIPKFDLDRVIDIRYPCELRNIQALATVAQASLNKLSFEVYNHGNLSIGPHGDISRVVEIDVSFPAAFGELESGTGQWEDAISISPSASIRSRGSLVLKQQLRVHNTAQVYQHVAAVFKLYLGKPAQVGSDGQTEVSLVHIVEISMQISDHHHYHPDASFLLVTNSEIGNERAQSIRRFVNNSLGMEIDTWNVCLYAGLDQRDPDSDAVRNILSRYHGKSIIFLGNRFDFFGQVSKTIFDVCDPEVIATAAAHDTNFLFLDTPDFESHEKLINEAVFCPGESTSDTKANISQSHRFHSVSDFITAITQQKQYSNLSHARYAITVSKKWYQAYDLKPQALARKVAKQLRRNLPTERFLITFDRPNLSKQPGIYPSDVIVAIGVPYHNSMAALERRATASALMADVPLIDGIPAAEAYMIVEAISLHRRVELLWSSTAGSDNNGDNALSSHFAAAALRTSLIQTTHREVELLLDKAPWPDKLLPSNPWKHSSEELKFLFAAHLPALHSILFHPRALEPTTVVNNHVKSVLGYALATTRPQSKLQIAAQALMPTNHRRQRAHAFLRAGIYMFLKKKGLTETQISGFFSWTDKWNISRNRNTGAAILRMVADLTNQSEYATLRGKQDASSLVRGAVYLSPGDWNSRAAAAKERSKRVVEEGNEAREILQRMLTPE